MGNGSLNAGIPAQEIVPTLATIRCDKPNPHYYAHRTVGIATVCSMGSCGCRSFRPSITDLENHSQPSNRRLVRLDEDTATLDQYAAFIKATADDVVDKALNYVFAKDRDFQDFLKTPEAKQISSTLRVRKAPNSEVVEQPPRKAVGVAASVEPARTLKP